MVQSSFLKVWKTTLFLDVKQKLQYMWPPDAPHTRNVYNEINGTNVRELSMFNTFTIYSHKSNNITKKAFCTRM